ncbi:HypC/HybG/HupF family hydrogenase formation chaperone [Corynebacterium felinum]|uniref:Hydrogenase expression/formation protein HypC n=1 Tax=Corynebacterium felinum TaxID=131318 RepID=A0ABU2B8F3_9CORY|nr:HypC/HybG/HupF family hydrogenase formation chaperone [Corynebacterium felinum]MDF5820245.1 HypC/HybG/HupF family hydrogenase formation chaperone [Corynebacterium felinum]MDR7354886.1 hydrogenase expression/formation protein HypC [Corynebacterium felinum]WJY94246.1 Hydrogenase isoenzymes formation protein HypC [Corynebacterium felinum]
MCLGIPARITKIGDFSSPMPMGEIDMVGEKRPCCFAYLPDAEVGQWVLIQNGFAMTTVSEEEAQLALAAIAEVRSTHNDDSAP